MPLSDLLQSYLFVTTPLALCLLFLIVFLASIVRGAIGFGFSAIVVASTSFWLPPISAVCLTVILEVIASLVMFRGVQNDVDYSLLLPLSIGTLAASIIGVTLLAVI
ncbi:MAG: TSUP family transporter, partial [Leucothrix sp.]